MRRETMTPNERLWSAIRLEQPDRVPIVPMLCPEPALSRPPKIRSGSS